MTKEMYAANVKNWLMDIAIGVKAMQNQVKYADGPDYKTAARCYDMFEDGVAIHGIKSLAKALDIEIKFEKCDKYDHNIIGHFYFDMFGVRFYDLAHRNEVLSYDWE